MFTSKIGLFVECPRNSEICKNDCCIYYNTKKVSWKKKFSNFFKEIVIQPLSLQYLNYSSSRQHNTGFQLNFRLMSC